MAIKTRLGYQCSYCHKLFDSPQKADACRNKHDLIYIGMTGTDLQNLVNFIFTKDDRLISEGLYHALQKGLKRAAIGALEYDSD